MLSYHPEFLDRFFTNSALYFIHLFSFEKYFNVCFTLENALDLCKDNKGKHSFTFNCIIKLLNTFLLF